MKLFYAIVFTAGFSSPALFAQETPDASPAPSMDCQEAITVFQDVSGMGRKDRAAKNMTQRHADMAKKGWRFIGLNVYTENGDLEGFFMSYERPAACASSGPTANGKN